MGHWSSQLDCTKNKLGGFVRIGVNMVAKLIPLEIGPEIQCPRCKAWDVWEDCTVDWFECWNCQLKIPPRQPKRGDGMYTYRIQLKKIDHYQIDIITNGPLTPQALYEVATKQGNREFGQSDDTELGEIELISTSISAGELHQNGDG